MFDILTVCTGNVCRSPLAEQLLRARLGDLGARVSSAGTHALEASPMTPEARHLAVNLGVPEPDADRHRARFLTEELLQSPGLILTMARDHRRAVVEIAPSHVRSTFTIREFARLAAATPVDDVREAAASAGPDASQKVQALAGVIAMMRGESLPPADPADDDVIDPYRRPWQVYQRSAAQLQPAILAVTDVLRTALAS